MSRCPKCGKKLHFYNVSQYCPHCGINMKFCNFEETFEREAKTAELAQAKYSVKIRNLKYSFMGSKLVKAKLAVMLLPLIAMFIPGGRYTVTYPFISFKSDFGLIGFIGAFRSGTIKFSHDMVSSVVMGDAFSSLFNAYTAYIITAAAAFFCLLFSLLGFISIKHMQKITAAAAAAGMVSSAASVVLIGVFQKKAEALTFIETSFAWNFIIIFLMFTAVFAVNIMLSKQGIHPVYEEGTMERYKLLQKLKKGEIKIEDLPLPVVETAETRKIDEEIAEQERLFLEKQASEVKKGEAQ